MQYQARSSCKTLTLTWLAANAIPSKVFMQDLHLDLTGCQCNPKPCLHARPWLDWLPMQSQARSSCKTLTLTWLAANAIPSKVFMQDLDLTGCQCNPKQGFHARPSPWLDWLPMQSQAMYSCKTLTLTWLAANAITCKVFMQACYSEFLIQRCHWFQTIYTFNGLKKVVFLILRHIILCRLKVDIQILLKVGNYTAVNVCCQFCDQ